MHNLFERYPNWGGIHKSDWSGMHKRSWGGTYERHGVELPKRALGIMVAIMIPREIDVHTSYSSRTLVLFLFADKSFGKGATK